MDTHHLTPNIAEPADTAPDDPLAGRTGDSARWRMAMLEELAEIGMVVARAFGKQVVAAVEAAEPRSAPSDSLMKAEAGFKSASRNVRQTLALHAKFEKQQREAPKKDEAEKDKAGEADGSEYSRFARAGSPRRRRNMVRRAVTEAMESEADRGNMDPRETENLLQDLREELEERLDEYEEFADFAEEPISALVSGLCRTMRITPVWRQFANEPWAIEEMRTKPPGSPFADWVEDWAEEAVDHPPDGPPDGPGDSGRERGPPQPGVGLSGTG